MSLLKTNEIQNYNGSSLTLTASTVSTSAQLNTGGNISVTGSLNVSDDSTTRTNLGLGTIATQDSDSITVTGGTATLGALTVSGSDSGDLVRITQTGSGNALVVEDSANPDSTPFVVDSSGNVGIGTGSASAKLDVNGTFKCVGAYPTSIGGTAGIFDGTNYYALWCEGSASLNANSRCLGNFAITGALSKGSGSFKIDHPLSELNETHHLVHSFIEGPQADNIYRGKVELVNGRAEVNIDINSGMTEGTFVALNREVQCFTSNETGWTAVKGFVSGNILTITAQDETCTDTISWLVIGERQDQHMYDTGWTDENGKVIVEPEKTLED